MSAPFATRKELRCAGIAFILTQILWGIAWGLHSIDYDVYDVHNEEQIIELHKVLSSPQYRMEMEIACACMWIAFPLALIAIYGMHKMLGFIFQESSGEMIVYLMERSYIIFVGFMSILIPTLFLVSVSYDWTFNETTANDNVVPTGYWIQLYVVIFEMELIDCATIADAVFLVSIFIGARFMMYMAKNDGGKMEQFRKIVQPNWCYKRRKCGAIIAVCIALTLLIIFLFGLFEFAESGFLSPTGHVKFLLISVFFIKIILGFRIVWISGSPKYDEIKELFMETDTQQLMSFDTGRINVATNDNEDDDEYA